MSAQYFDPANPEECRNERQAFVAALVERAAPKVKQLWRSRLASVIGGVDRDVEAHLLSDPTTRRVLDGPRESNHVTVLAYVQELVPDLAAVPWFLPACVMHLRRHGYFGSENVCLDDRRATPDFVPTFQPPELRWNIRDADDEFKRQALASYGRALDEYISRVRSDAENRGWQQAPKFRSRDGRDLEGRIAWLLDAVVDRKKSAQIARDAGVERASVRDAVKRLAEVLGITLPPEF
jgi:hypothetical protein